ncbi:MAG: hypothetical protein MI742_04165 [Desulfobacterales bacterium]|nr:hypothetical protein [Desulfobacterales bacterium]
MKKVTLFSALLLPVYAFAQESAVVPKSSENTPMTDINDIVSPIYTGLSGALKEGLVYGGAGLLVVGLSLLGLWLWFRRKQGPKNVCVVVEPAEIVALKAFETLAPLRHSDGKAFYFELSEALRHYIKGRFFINASEMTAEEFLASLGSIDLEAGQRDYLKEMTLHGEPVKFAGQMASLQVMDADLNGARRFVMETTPRPQEDQERKDS